MLRGRFRRLVSPAASEEESNEASLSSRSKRCRQETGSSAEGTAGPSATLKPLPKEASTEQTVAPFVPPVREAAEGPTMQPLPSQVASAAIPPPTAAMLEKSPLAPAPKRSRRRFKLAGATEKR